MVNSYSECLGCVSTCSLTPTLPGPNTVPVTVITLMLATLLVSLGGSMPWPPISSFCRPYSLGSSGTWDWSMMRMSASHWSILTCSNRETVRRLGPADLPPADEKCIDKYRKGNNKIKSSCMFLMFTHPDCSLSCSCFCSCCFHHYEISSDPCPCNLCL